MKCPKSVQQNAVVKPSEPGLFVIFHTFWNNLRLVYNLFPLVFLNLLTFWNNNYLVSV